LPERSIWTSPIGRAQRIIDNIAAAELTAVRISQNAEELRQVAEAYDGAHSAGECISKVRSWVLRPRYTLEVVRDTSFIMAAGLQALPRRQSRWCDDCWTGWRNCCNCGLRNCAVGVAGTTGGVVRGGLEVGAPGLQADVPAANGSNVVILVGMLRVGSAAQEPCCACRLRGHQPAAFWRIHPGASRHWCAARRRALTGLTIGAPSGLLDAAIVNAPALARGEITATEYLQRIGWGLPPALPWDTFWSVSGSCTAAAYNYATWPN